MASGPSCIDGRTIRSVAVSAAISLPDEARINLQTIRTEKRGKAAQRH